MRRRNHWDYLGPGDLPHPQDDDLDSWRHPDDAEMDERDRLAAEKEDDDEQEQQEATAGRIS